MPESTFRPICDYEGSRYRTEFWTREREYEDRAERIALGKLLPSRGGRLIEIGAGAGRLADLYLGYDQVVLMDYARSTLLEAREQIAARWPQHLSHFLFVAADLYSLPFVPGAFDTVTMVRVIHHVADVPAALGGVAAIFKPGGVFVLEFANRRNLKAIVRYAARRQAWSPFAPEPYEFAPLNWDFNPDWMQACLKQAGFGIDRTLSVSHFRAGVLKRLFPARWLAAADGAVQEVGAVWKLSPSIFVRSHAPAANPAAQAGALFRCPACRSLEMAGAPEGLVCGGCGKVWPLQDGVYTLKEQAGA